MCTSNCLDPQFLLSLPTICAPSFWILFPPFWKTLCWWKQWGVLNIFSQKLCRERTNSISGDVLWDGYRIIFFSLFSPFPVISWQRYRRRNVISTPFCLGDVSCTYFLILSYLQPISHKWSLLKSLNQITKMTTNYTFLSQIWFWAGSHGFYFALFTLGS